MTDFIVRLFDWLLMAFIWALSASALWVIVMALFGDRDL